MHSILVKEIMTTPVITVTPETLVIDAAELMEEHNIRRVPVVNEDGQLRGMLTDTDVVEAETAEYSSSTFGRSSTAEWIRVADVMSHDVVTVGIDYTVGELANTFLEHKVGGVPVICTKKHSHGDEDVDCPQELLGIVTETDIFKLIVDDWRDAQADENTELNALLAEVALV